MTSAVAVYRAGPWTHAKRGRVPRNSGSGGRAITASGRTIGAATTSTRSERSLHLEARAGLGVERGRGAAQRAGRDPAQADRALRAGREVEAIVVGAKPRCVDRDRLREPPRAHGEREVVAARDDLCGEADLGLARRRHAGGKPERLAGAEPRMDDVRDRRPEAIRARQIEPALEQRRGGDLDRAVTGDRDLRRRRADRDVAGAVQRDRELAVEALRPIVDDMDREPV